MKDNYTYPAVLDYSEDGIINISFPDFPEAFSFSENETEVVSVAQEVLALAIRDYEEIGKELPISSSIPTVQMGQKLIYVNVWMPFFRTKIKEVYVKKTLTIPEWLNILAVQNNINFSSVLVEGLKQKLSLGGED